MKLVPSLNYIWPLVWWRRDPRSARVFSYIFSHFLAPAHLFSATVYMYIYFLLFVRFFFISAICQSRVNWLLDIREDRAFIIKFGYCYICALPLSDYPHLATLSAGAVRALYAHSISRVNAISRGLKVHRLYFNFRGRILRRTKYKVVRLIFTSIYIDTW